MTAPFEPGDFVWTNFPFEADPNHPGPGRHAALIMATFGTREAAQISAKPAPKLHTITIEAQDIGRYAWARFGFVPDRTAWMRSVRVEARRRLKMANAEISPTAMVAYGEILDGENPKLIREVASWRYPVTSIVKFKGHRSSGEGSAWTGFAARNSRAVVRHVRSG
jgi:hypothetical protein